MSQRQVYNVFQINLIVFLVTIVMLVPILSILSYIFDLHRYTSVSIILIVAGIITAVAFVIGLLSLLWTREQYRRRLKPSYPREFTILMSVSALGVLGVGILFLYIDGRALYVPHVIIPLGIAVFSGLYLLGDRFFNVSLLRRNKR
jgi:hypothetical protein